MAAAVAIQADKGVLWADTRQPSDYFFYERIEDVDSLVIAGPDTCSRHKNRDRPDVGRVARLRKMEI